jgi:hypothetical protein
VWYSYWLRTSGYGAAGRDPSSKPTKLDALGGEDRERLRGWIAQMTLDNSVAVFGTLVITLAFLILGVELLRPQGLIPEEDRVAEVLGRLLGEVWGPIGFWFMIAAVFVGFWDTVLSDQDGFGRMFGDGTRIVLQRALPPNRWVDERFLQKGFLLVLLTLLPVGLYLVVGEPVGLLKIAGAIEAAHIPVVASLTLFLNQRELPEELRPSRPVWLATALAAIFFVVFAGVYVVQLVRGGG